MEPCKPCIKILEEMCRRLKDNEICKISKGYKEGTLNDEEVVERLYAKGEDYRPLIEEIKRDLALP